MKLIDADELSKAMYKAAFETDSDMQRWDSGCWIRYKLFEQVLAKMPEYVIAPNVSHRNYGGEFKGLKGDNNDHQ